jgi:hypothetical protein
MGALRLVGRGPNDMSEKSRYTLAHA